MITTKITDHQLFTLTATISMGGSLLVSSSTIAAVARQDAWLSGLIAIATGVPVALLYYFLGSKYPGKTLIGIVKEIFGKWLGFALGFVYIMFFTVISMHIPWYIGNFFGRAMRETPITVIVVLFIAGVVIAMFYGIEVIARASELFTVFVTVFFILLIALAFKDIKTEYMTPVLERGFFPPFKGSFFLSTYITYSMLNVLMIFPRFISDMPRARKAIVKGFLWSGVISFVAILVTNLVLGYSLTSRLTLPMLYLALNINIGAVLTRLEYILTMIWLATQFMVGFAFFFSAVTGLSELVGLKDHKRIVLPYGLVVLIMSGVVLPNPVYQGNWVNSVFTPYATTLGLFIPLIMAFVYLLKRKASGGQ
jgi:spore germination protein KB